MDKLQFLVLIYCMRAAHENQQQRLCRRRYGFLGRTDAGFLAVADVGRARSSIAAL